MLSHLATGNSASCLILPRCPVNIKKIKERGDLIEVAVMAKTTGYVEVDCMCIEKLLNDFQYSLR